MKRPTHESQQTPQPAPQATVGEEIQDTLKGLMPWGISLLIHLALVILAIVLVFTTIRDPQNSQDPPPQISLNPTPQVDLRQTLQESPVKPTPTPHQPLRSVTPSQAQQLRQPVQLDNAMIGLAGGQIVKAAPESAFVRTPAPTGMFEPGPQADSVVYVIDASGSLIDTLPFVTQELRRSIFALEEHQKFTVIFFQGDSAFEVPPFGLKRADHHTKRQVAAWISTDAGHVVPRGRTNPIQAIRQALSYRPDVVHLLSDNITGHGQHEVNQEALVEEIRTTNVAKTQINTIQFLYPDPLVPMGFQPTMQLISQTSGGQYRFYDGRQLGIH